ncbi:hypothetical protein [Enteractinococcus fodinae]|uniref:Uncharacterized protein n=1 Tax=Enteractinococcus fodinae TaxID=684663 RepID=A0ABU2B492_9MICC|nr:hypothetical protein [Enteractinococcus fodinae]MDR7347613.1 hypothetical protein [Enteractinococcus fodinae]
MDLLIIVLLVAFITFPFWRTFITKRAERDRQRRLGHDGSA